MTHTDNRVTRERLRDGRASSRVGRGRCYVESSALGKRGILAFIPPDDPAVPVCGQMKVMLPLHKEALPEALPQLRVQS